MVTTKPSRRFSAADLPALTMLAAQAALALENARLRQKVHDREQQVSFLLKETIDAQENERERICLEVHDGVAQTMSAAFHYLQALDSRPDLPEDARASIRRTGGLVRTAIHEAREIIGSLRPASLDTLGLGSTLRFEVEEISPQAGWRIEFDADNARFPKAIETALYRIVHEAINNVRKHAHARQVSVRIKQQSDTVIAEVQDDGTGFNPQVLDRQQRGKGVGLLSMRKRAELLQGRFEIQSNPGRGTLVRVKVPLPGSEGGQARSSEESGTAILVLSRTAGRTRLDP